MATTLYLEAALPMAGAKGEADKCSPKTMIEILVSSYSGEHAVYLKIVELDGKERSLVLSKKHTVELLEGLERAAFYLQYVK